MIVTEKVKPEEKPELPKGVIKKAEETVRLERFTKVLENFDVTYKNRKITTPQEYEEVRESFQEGDVIHLTDKKTRTLITLPSPDFRIECFEPREKAKERVKGKEEWEHGIQWKTADVNQGKAPAVYTFNDSTGTGELDVLEETDNQTIPAKRNAENVFGIQGNYEYECGPYEDGAGGAPSWKPFPEVSKFIVKTCYIENVSEHVPGSGDAMVLEKLSSIFGVPLDQLRGMSGATVTQGYVDDREGPTKWLVAYVQCYDKNDNPFIYDNQLMGSLWALLWQDCYTDPDDPYYETETGSMHLAVGWPSKAVYDTSSPHISYIEYKGIAFGSKPLYLPCFVGIEKVGPGPGSEEIPTGKEEYGILVRSPTTAKPMFAVRSKPGTRMKVGIYNVTGQQVWKWEGTATGEKTELRMDKSLSSGTYFARLEAEGIKKTAKFTVIK